MKKSPSVTVALFNFNGVLDTKKCLRSLLKTSYPNFEIFVIDDGSKNDEITPLKKLFSDKRIHYFQDGKNKGFSVRVNEVLKESKDTYVVLLNNDTTVEKDWLAHLINAAESDKRVAICQSKLRWMKNPEYFEYAGASGGYIDKLGYPYTRGRVMFTIEKDIGQYDNVKEIFWACGAAMLIRRSVGKLIGGFDTDFFAHQEEIDFCWRVKKSGYKIIVVPRSIVYHKGSGFWRNQSTKKAFLVHRNNLILLIKNLSVLELIWIFPARVLFDSFSVIFYMRQRRWSFVYALCTAYVAILVKLPYWWRKRSKGLNPKRFPFSVVIYYYILGKKTFSSLFGNPISKNETINYEQFFLGKEIVYSLKAVPIKKMSSSIKAR